jgi:signal transduction histidine kinase
VDEPRRAAPPGGGPPEAELSRSGLLACRAFFQGLGQTAKLVSLYHPTHPVPAAALREASHLLERLMSENSLEQATFTLADGRWLANGIPIAESTQISEVLLGMFRTHHVSSLTIERGALLFELAALCELAALPSHKAEDLDLPDALKQRGVRRVRLDVEQYRKAGPAAPPRAAGRVASPLRSAPGEGGAGAGGAGGGAAGWEAGGMGGGGGAGETGASPREGHFSSAAGFGALIKSLVSGAVSDPEEQAQIYAETVRMVRDAMERRVGEATARLEGEKRRATFERARTERVFESVADGRVVVDKEGRVLMMDPRAEAIVGKRLCEVAGKPLAEGAAGAGQLVALAQDLELDPARAPSEKVDVSGDETAETLRKAMALVHDENGRVVGACGVLPSVAKMRELERLGDEFIAGVTHELKAPLASIYSALEMVSGTAAGKLSEQERRFLAIGTRNALKLRQMIDEILDFSKIQSGHMSVHAAAVPLGAILSEGVESLRPWASSRGIALALGPSAAKRTGTAVLADHQRIVQVVINLISNAIKATPDGGAIAVDAEFGVGAEAGSVVVSVTDTGCGIAQEDLTRIFERFTQVVPKGRTREGVGLGLTIVRQIVGLHRGTMGVKSAPGAGSTFSFTLPLAEVHAAVP